MYIYSSLRNIYFILIKKKREKYLKSLVKLGLKLGKNVDIIDKFTFDPSHCFLISIGDNCTICPNVKLIAHDASSKKLLGYTKIGMINIRENCFIGDSAIILPGVTIGPNTIVAAGAVVTRGDFPPGTIIGGNPAKVIMTVVEYMKKIENISNKKKIFSDAYFIDRLDDNKKAELIKSIGNSIGFIV